jgi:hypothetical protein
VLLLFSVYATIEEDSLEPAGEDVCRPPRHDFGMCPHPFGEAFGFVARDHTIRDDTSDEAHHLG